MSGFACGKASAIDHNTPEFDYLGLVLSACN